jgi:hypothetical protein
MFFHLEGLYRSCGFETIQSDSNMADCRDDYCFTNCNLLLRITGKPVLRGHLWDKEKCFFKTGDLSNRGSMHMNFSMTGQDKVDLLIQVTAWTCLTMIVFTLIILIFQ